jgi:hypothetical protein
LELLKLKKIIKKFLNIETKIKQDYFFLLKGLDEVCQKDEGMDRERFHF